MEGTSMGEMIAAIRKEKGMTQKELADQLGITDKAVSKWERNIAYPDTATIPKLAQLLGIPVEDLLQAKSTAGAAVKPASPLINLILKAVPMAMGIAVVVTSLLGKLDLRSGFILLGLGLACIGAYLMKNGK